MYRNGMGTGISGFYDDFAANYHLLFEDWEASIIRQAAAIVSILERECPATRTTILDCACGIGTQALGLVKLGFWVTGADVSAGAIERARSAATARKLKISGDRSRDRDSTLSRRGAPAVIAPGNSR